MEGVAIISVEQALWKLGQTVAKQLLTTWLADRRAAARRGRNLEELLASRFPVPREQRAARRRVEEIADEVVRALEPLLEREFLDLTDNERDAAVHAVADVLGEADLSDQVLLGADLDPTVLTGQIRRQLPSAQRRAGLSEAGAALFDLVLDRSCCYLAHVVRELPEFEPRATVETLRRLSAMQDGVGRLLERLPAPTLDAAQGTHIDEEFRRRYRSLVATELDELELIGVSTRNFRPRTTLTVAYLSLTVSGSGLRTTQEMAQRWFTGDRDTHASSATVRVESALGSRRRLLVRGEAGCGKTTLLRWLAVTAARSGFRDQLAEWNGCVPFLVKLRSYADRPLPTPEELLNDPSAVFAGPTPTGWAHRQLATGVALLLVDGVDELAAPQRRDVRAWLRRTLAAYPEVRVVVTSRPGAAAEKWLDAEGFESVVVERMTPAHVQVFVQRWHAAVADAAGGRDVLPCGPEELGNYQRRLLAHLDTRAHLRGLASNPLMCAMLCALHLDRGANLPRDRMSLYRAALELLLERRDVERNVPAGRDIALDHGAKAALLADLAWWLTLNGRAELPRATALRLLEAKLRTMPNVRVDAETALTHLLERSGVLREPAVDRLDFVHRTFQEFLAAQEAAEASHVDLLVNHAHTDQWRETVVMACAHLNRAQRADLLTALLDRADHATARIARRLRLLAATCLEAVRDVPPEVLARVHAVLGELVPPRSTAESRSLATVGDTLLPLLPDTPDHLTEAQAAACVRTTALINGPDAIPILARYANDPRSKVQREITDGWQYFEPAAYAHRVLAHAALGDMQVQAIGSTQMRLLQHVPVRRCWIHLKEERDIDLAPLAHLAEVDDLTLSVNEPFSLSSILELNKLQALGLMCAVLPTTELHGLRRLPRLQDLFLNTRRTGVIRDLNFLGELSHLRRLNLVDPTHVRDYSPLRHLTSLESLWLQDCPHLPDLRPLAHLRNLTILHLGGLALPRLAEQITTTLPGLSWLGLQRCPDIGDLNALRNLPLEYVFLSETPPPDLVPLADIPTFRRLQLGNFTEPVDLRPLAGRRFTLLLNKETQVIGLDQLRPHVRIRRFS